MTHQLWTNLNNRMLDYLNGVTLAELVAQQNHPEAAVLKDERPARRLRRPVAEAIAA
jgi:DNA-binding IscR family transcriptional regulator